MTIRADLAATDASATWKATQLILPGLYQFFMLQICCADGRQNQQTRRYRSHVKPSACARRSRLLHRYPDGDHQGARHDLRPEKRASASAIAATFVGLTLISLDRCQALISRSNSRTLLLDPAQLSSECEETCSSHFRNSLVVWIGDNSEQLLDAVTPDRRNDPELGKMGSDCIDHCRLLTDEQMAGAVQHQAALLLGSLGWYKPHVGPGDRLANRLCISRVILLPLDVAGGINRTV